MNASTRTSDARTQTPVMPTRRDLKFRLPAERIADWQGEDGAHIAHFMNTLSLFFPVGERFFIDAVRQYRDRIADPELQKAVTAFIGQEAMHGREHEEYNEAMFAAVPATKSMERFVARFLKVLQERTPPRMRLSATIALEHFTAIMADGLLRDPRLLEKADPRFAALWRWHALEETEHKAVAYDVWEVARGRGTGAYLERTAGLVAATAIFWAIAIPFYLRVIQAEGRLTDVRGWRRFVRYTFTEQGFLTRLVRPWADYFRRDFHPWDHDNRHYLEQVDELVDGLKAA
jgi:predicted metal-dependent hydrolase